MHKLSASVIRSNGSIVFRAPAIIRRAVYERDSFTCRECGFHGEPGRGEGSIQAFHLKPVREGGEHTLDNLVTLCYVCRGRHEKRRRGHGASPYRRSYRNASARSAAAAGGAETERPKLRLVRRTDNQIQ